MPELDPMTTNPDLANALGKEGITSGPEVVDEGPSYRILGSKIPVSKKLGQLWSSRIDQSRASRRDVEDSWTEAIRYYNNDQTVHRTSEDDSSGNKTRSRIGRSWSETENIVFVNATTMLPLLYAKNPTIEVTPVGGLETNAAWATACEALVNKLFWMQTTPGVRMKPTARRGVLWCQLTNSAYSKINWIDKKDSSEQALEDLQKISDEYAKAKTKKEIEIAEGKLKALEEKVSLLTPSGPSVKLVSPFNLFIDPTSTEADHSDASWMAEKDYLPTTYLNAVYGKSSDGKITSVYEPTHVLNANTNTTSEIEDQVNSFSIFNTETEKDKIGKSYGYQSSVAFEKAQYTEVYWIWDRTTRRVFLYAANKWEWPLWVWDDPLKLQEFFPYRHLWFHETVEGSQPKGEVTYYLDQQDRINDNNATIAQARSWAKNKIFYDNNKMSQSDAEKYLKGDDGTAVGVNVPEGMKITDVVFSVVPPALAHPDLLNNNTAYEFINKVTGINAAMQGAQFKTNTTNDAVNFYQQNVDIRVDEKIDCIEDWVGSIGWQLIQIAAQKWTKEQVAEIIGPEAAQGWQQVANVEELRKSLALRVVGGSTDKPTSKNKKKAAIEVTQVLGQFGNGIPAVAIVALKILNRAFADDITMTEADWKMIFDSMKDQANAAGGGPGEAGGAPGTEGEGGDQSVLAEQIKKVVAELPPEMQGQLEALVNSGVPAEEAIKQITGQTQQQAA